MRKSLSALFILIPSFWAVADGVELRQQYKNGFRYLQTVNITQDSSVSTGVSNSTTKSAPTLDLETIAQPAVVAGGKGTALTVRYAKVAMTVERDGRTFRFPVEPAEGESANANPNAQAGPLLALGAVTGRAFTVNLNEQGAVDSVQNAEAAVATLAGSGPLTNATFRDMFSKETIARIFSQTMIRTPKGQLPKNGESWPLSQEIVMPGLGALEVSGSYKLVGTVDYEGAQCADIEVSATISKRPPAREIQDLQDNDRFDTLSGQMRLKLDGSTMTGRILFDPVISFPRSISITQSLAIEAKIPDGTKNVFKMPIKQTTSVKLVEMTDVHPE